MPAAHHANAYEVVDARLSMTPCLGCGLASKDARRFWNRDQKNDSWSAFIQNLRLLRFAPISAMRRLPSFSSFFVPEFSQSDMCLQESVGLIRSVSARSVIEFDTVSAEAGDRAADWIKTDADERDTFGLLRLTTTPGRFSEFAQDIVDVQPGFWLYLMLSPKVLSNGVRAWFAGHTALGLTEISRGNVVEAECLISTIDPVPRPSSLGAATLPAKSLPSAIAAVCRIPQRSSRLVATDILTRVPQADEVLIHDVGQGSFSTLLRDGRPCLHFDVGAPTAFNARGARTKPFSVDLDTRVPIVLSH